MVTREKPLTTPERWPSSIVRKTLVQKGSLDEGKWATKAWQEVKPKIYQLDGQKCIFNNYLVKYIEIIIIKEKSESTINRNQ